MLNIRPFVERRKKGQVKSGKSSYSKVAHSDWVLHQALKAHGPADDPASRTVYLARTISSSRAAAQTRAAACARQPRHVQLFRERRQGGNMKNTTGFIFSDCKSTELKGRFKEHLSIKNN